MVYLSYFKGLLICDVSAPGLSWSEELKAYIGPASKYRDLIFYFKRSNVEVQDKVLDLLPFPIIDDKIQLRKYQEDALLKWFRTRQGIIVLPTGAGKTVIGLKAIALIKQATLIVVPTLDLLQQWYESIKKLLNVEAGRIGGGFDEIKGITVATYDSTYTRLESIGNKFALVIFDEVHHLASEGYSIIAQGLASPYRLGLTATPERSDGRHSLYPSLVGPIVYTITFSELAGKFLSNFTIQRIYVELTEEERKKYEYYRGILKKFLDKKGLQLRSLQDFRNLIKLASRDKEAREALLAWHEALKIAVNSRAKVEKLRELLSKLKDDKVIIFTRNTSMAYDISRTFLIPAITYKTPKNERLEILEKFKEGEYKVIVTSSVLDEGVDVPDASVGIVLGGYGTQRQFVQRLGRILRKKENKIARLIEIVSKGTSDYNLSKRRRQNVAI
ncbi:ATP-dependent helicase [Sulfolobus sp. E1]|uniref:DEAD/DEAH box helicase n=1 Tax=Saccharolobus sp. A20 TaxID=1891280 RepID=UPI00084604AB|nr:DEAD/DEAH box helicase [Sulfolobus sp. A20]TRM75608.1 ATP-dependent helicase [Sulfolobus sp. E5]TRM78540.1 ATP-dependent helicase [Sulfolobus sp. A20-N-F8]TRM82077.1 ATP-dependent helicase [Sulfolobus sp. D5]TRM89827.1 ATP-dependent helicase [Sulfolobus sp. C3]TRM95346.1 ATP-dependent helicase [Sulfolobus sp. A20-N-G8]TRN02057.1 ATP-dependent helicase [Sulfolobus sp. F1]TRN03021.1 ATP-dependent helicase [Sulfolobus sp. E1]